MLMIVFKLHIHDTIFPRMRAVIATFPSKSRLQQRNSSWRDLRLFKGGKLTQEMPLAWNQWVVQTDLEKPTSKKMIEFYESILRT